MTDRTPENRPMSNHKGWYREQVFHLTRKYVCGYCGLSVASDKGLWRDHADRPDPHRPALYLCPLCEKPTFFEGDKQVPGVAFGEAIGHLPDTVGGLYNEARNCMAVNAFTAAVLAARKLLMNVAASQGADPGQTFQHYVQWLERNGYVPPKAREWVDHIRKKGNEATHEIPGIDRKDAEEIITFAEMILKMVFDYPARAKAATGS